MGHVLSFTHCKDAPSTASSTPDSCPPDGDLDDLTVTPVDLWPPPSPHEPTFSYITVGSSSPLTRPPARARRGRGQIKAPITRREGPEEEVVTYVLLEKVCQLTQALPPQIQEEVEFVAKPQPQRIDFSAVKDLLYWRDTLLSAGCLTGVTLSLLCLSQFSVISVLSYGCLIVLSATLALRLYTQLMHALKRGSGANPFQQYLDADLTLSTQQVEAITARALSVFCSTAGTLRSLFLVQDVRESLKFLVLLYLLTYVGAVFNGLTLLLLCVIGAFTFPILYKQHQTQVDCYVSLVSKKLNGIRASVRALFKKPAAKQK
ncbi:reticulon-2 isoform 2-T2 [Rhinophrynus dorsalis]